MPATSATLESATEPWSLPDKGRVGMICLIIAESAIFTIFVVAYLYYLGRDMGGPTPKQVLELPLLNTVCLLSSSVTITFALRALARGAVGAFGAWWFATIALGSYFLWGTAMEWRTLIVEKGLTLQVNLFGTTFYSLVGLHAFHVVIGLLMLAIVLIFAVAKRVSPVHHARLDVLSLYWHFVDAVWIVVFTVVYIIGR